MKKFTEEENNRVNFLISQLSFPKSVRLPLSRFFEYDDELFKYAEEGHPKAEKFYLS